MRLTNKQLKELQSGIIDSILNEIKKQVVEKVLFDNRDKINFFIGEVTPKLNKTIEQKLIKGR